MHRAIRLGLWIWFVPFLLSIPFIDASGDLKIQLVLFKLIMAASLLVATILAYRSQSPTLPTAWSAAGIASILDFFVLGLIFGQPFVLIVTQVIPMYLLVPATVALFNTKNKDRGSLHGQDD